jgi:hypothetical protein
MTMEGACYYFRGRHGDCRPPEFLPLIISYGLFRSVAAVAAGKTDKQGYYPQELSRGRIWFWNVVLLVFLLAVFNRFEQPEFRKELHRTRGRNGGRSGSSILLFFQRAYLVERRGLRSAGRI